MGHKCSVIAQLNLSEQFVQLYEQSSIHEVNRKNARTNLPNQLRKCQDAVSASEMRVGPHEMLDRKLDQIARYTWLIMSLI